jgi:hypothetical protein
MRAVEVTANLKDGENGTHVPIPTSEYQVMALVRLTPEEQRKAWRLATEKWPDPTERQVASAAYYAVWRRNNPHATPEITSKQPESSSSEQVAEAEVEKIKLLIERFEKHVNAIVRDALQINSAAKQLDPKILHSVLSSVFIHNLPHVKAIIDGLCETFSEAPLLVARTTTSSAAHRDKERITRSEYCL